MPDSATLKLVDAEPHHYPAILEINESALPHVNSIDLKDLTSLAAQSAYFRVVELPNAPVAGFLLAMREGQSYKSLNYRWFNEQYEKFVYVDRIVVAEEHADAGCGKVLYHDLIDAVAKETPVITCEVNLKPANERSLGFHQRLGFAEVGRQETEGGAKTVCLMARRSGASS